MRSFLLFLLLWPIVLKPSSCSQIGVSFGDTSVTQLIHYAASKVLEEPRVFDALVKTRETPSFGPIAKVYLFNAVSYRNVSLRFHEDVVQVFFERLNLISHSNISDVFWPVPLSDSCLNARFEVEHGYLKMNFKDQKLEVTKCTLHSPVLALSVDDSWFFDTIVKGVVSTVTTVFEGIFCSFLYHQLSEIDFATQSKVPIHQFLPRRVQDIMAAKNTTLYYKLESVEASEHQMSLRAQVQWETLIMNDEAANILNSYSLENSTLIDMQLEKDDVVTLWLEDSILNDLLSQLDWNFEWLQRDIPASSPIIPEATRAVLQFVCAACRFLINVTNNGRPTITATNNSLVLTQRDRINLKVLNNGGEKVVAAVALTVEAELRPSFDNGTLRTLVELIGTEIAFDDGAVPSAMRNTVSDFVEDMIQELIWPALKSKIEDMTFQNGVRFNTTCGVDPNKMQIDIGEGSFSVSAKLKIPMFDAENCFVDIVNSLPKNVAIFQGLVD